MSEPGTAEWRLAEASRLITFGRAAALADGGFGWLDAHGVVDVRRPCPLYVNARMTYVFALAHLGGVVGAESLAASGLQALATRYADGDNGGWFSSIDLSGRVNDFTKTNYAHAHTLLAAASAVAAGIPGADSVFAAASAAIEQHFWSDAEGCARESWNADFTEGEPYRGANSNMHSVEAYLAAGDVTGDPVWHARAASIATRLINGHARAHSWRIPEHYDESWQPLPDYNADHRNDQFRPYGTTPGHSFEWARLLLSLEAAQEAQAAEVAQMAQAATPGWLHEAATPGWLHEAATALFDTAVADAWSRDGHPGFIYTVDALGQPVVTARMHWVACEAVLAADALYRRTGEERFATAAERWWGEIDRYFLDADGGSWWPELAPDMTPAASTWSGKPDLYHAYQAVLLPSLPLSPTAATALARRRSAAARPDQGVPSQSVLRL
jgi:sulfoquinovose isomerase